MNNSATDGARMLHVRVGTPFAVGRAVMAQMPANYTTGRYQVHAARSRVLCRYCWGRNCERCKTA